MNAFLENLKRRVLVIDGAMGTSIHSRNLDLEQDFGGLENCCEIVNERQPDVIYAPSRVDFHPDHHKVARSLAQFLQETGHQPIVRIVQLQVPMTSVLANLVASGEGLLEKAAAARESYRTQIFNVDPTQRMRRYAGARYRIGAEVEEYWQLSARSYCVLHGDDDVCLVVRQADG